MSDERVVCGDQIGIYSTESDVRLKITRDCDGADLYNEMVESETTWITCNEEWFTDFGDTEIDSMLIRVTIKKDGQILEESFFTLLMPPRIAVDLEEEMLVGVGDQIKLYVKALYGRCKYCWQMSEDDGETWTDILRGWKDEMLRFTAGSDKNGLQYRCVIKNSVGRIVSTATAITALVRPSILIQPEKEYAALGSTGGFRITARGDEISYRWQEKMLDDEEWVNCTSKGATTPELSVSAIEENDGKLYRCVIRNKLMEIFSEPRVLTVVWPPTIMFHPENATVAIDGSAGFVVIAGGTEPILQWQYRKNSSSEWKNIGAGGEMKNMIQFTASASLNGYQFRCMAFNIAGTVYSNPATLYIVQRFCIADGTNSIYKNVLPAGDYYFNLNADRPGIVYSLGFGVPGDMQWICENNNSACVFHTDGKMPIRISINVADPNMIGTVKIYPTLVQGTEPSSWISPVEEKHDMAKDFNFNWFSLANTLDNKENIVTSTLPCDLTIRYRPIWKDTL